VGRTMIQRVAQFAFYPAVFCAASTPMPAASPAWPDTFVARVEALALIQSLNADLLSSESATRSLEKWCGEHGLAEPPRIIAHRVDGAAKPPSAEQRKRLKVGDEEAVRYRRVQLRCGEHILSEAENWYVPSRLSAEANRLLDTTETPFGVVARPIKPYRRTFAVKMLWSPLPDGWAHRTNGSHPPDGPPATLVIPSALFEHRAVLYTPEHLPFSEVYEVYQRQILAFPPPEQ